MQIRNFIILISFSLLSLSTTATGTSVFSEKVCSVSNKSPFGNGQPQANVPFEWGPNIMFLSNGNTNAGLFEIDAGTDIGLKVDGRVEMNGDVSVNKKTHIQREENVMGKRLKVKSLTVDTLRIGRYIIRVEAIGNERSKDVLVIRDMKIANTKGGRWTDSTNYRYAFFPEKAVELN